MDVGFRNRMPESFFSYKDNIVSLMGIKANSVILSRQMELLNNDIKEVEKLKKKIRSHGDGFTGCMTRIMARASLILSSKSEEELKTEFTDLESSHRQLQSQFQNQVNLRDAKGDTGLMLAVKSGDSDAVSEYIRLGVDLNASNNGKTALDLVCEMANNEVIPGEIILLLMNGGAACASNEKNLSTFITLAMNVKSENLRNILLTNIDKILKEKPELVDTRNFSGDKNALSCALKPPANSHFVNRFIGDGVSLASPEEIRGCERFIEENINSMSASTTSQNLALANLVQVTGNLRLKNQFVEGMANFINSMSDDSLESSLDDILKLADDFPKLKSNFENRVPYYFRVNDAMNPKIITNFIKLFKEEIKVKFDKNPDSYEILADVRDIYLKYLLKSQIDSLRKAAEEEGRLDEFDSLKPTYEKLHESYRAEEKNKFLQQHSSKPAGKLIDRIKSLTSVLTEDVVKIQEDTMKIAKQLDKASKALNSLDTKSTKLEDYHLGGGICYGACLELTGRKIRGEQDALIEVSSHSRFTHAAYRVGKRMNVVSGDSIDIGFQKKLEINVENPIRINEKINDFIQNLEEHISKLDIEKSPHFILDMGGDDGRHAIYCNFSPPYEIQDANYPNFSVKADSIEQLKMNLLFYFAFMQPTGNLKTINSIIQISKRK